MKQKILTYLKEYPKTSAGRISALLGINYYVLEKLLNEMEKDNLVIKHKEDKATYWSKK